MKNLKTQRNETRARTFDDARTTAERLIFPPLQSSLGIIRFSSILNFALPSHVVPSRLHT